MCLKVMITLISSPSQFIHSVLRYAFTQGGISERAASIE